MNRKIIVVMLLFLLINAQCKKENKNEIDVSAITQTDVAGNQNGLLDNTDWTRDQTWTNNEMNLFETPQSSQLMNTETATISISPAYPNPISSVFMFNFNASGGTLLEMVITDKFLTVKDRHYYLAHADANFLQVNLHGTQYANNTNYRVYYSFYSLADGQYFKGHGDIKIAR